MPEAVTPNATAALAERRVDGRLTWSGPILILFARSVLAVAAQGLVAAGFAARGSAAPWREAGAWLPVYGTLIDLGCLLLGRLMRREGIRLRDLLGFERGRLGRDLLLALALVPPSLVFILAGNAGASLLVWGRPTAAMLFSPLPLWAALYAVLIFPFIWGLVEQTIYNGYAVPRLQVLIGRTAPAVALVAFFWSVQHVFMPLTPDPGFMLYRALSPIPHSLFIILVWLRLRRILPLALAHGLMDGGAAFAGTLLPLLR